MAQSGFTPISLYYSATASAVPVNTNLANGELALNTADMKLYAKNSSGVVTLLASSGGAAGTVSSVSGTGTVSGISLSGTVTTSGNLTLGGALNLSSPPAIGGTAPAAGAFTTLTASTAIGTASGGTGLSSFTSGGVVYASSSSALATGSALKFDGTTLTSSGNGVLHNLNGSGSAFTDYQVAGAPLARVGTQAFVAGDLTLVTLSNAPIIFGINTTEKMRLDSSGNLLVGSTSNILTAKVLSRFNGSTSNGLVIDDLNNTSAAGFIAMSVSSGIYCGGITRVGATSAVTYNTTSDYRLKTVVGAVSGQGERIDALKPIDYQWNKNNHQARGFLAHEFQTVYPNSVSGDKDAVNAEGNPVYQGMQASSAEVIADLVAEIQSLRQRLSAANL